MSELMPAAFIGHGSPMNTLDDNRFTQAWRQFGSSVPRPRAILCVSAHWLINASALTAMKRPRTIHDFYGFPDELFQIQYLAPGAPEVAAEIAKMLKPEWIGLDADSWGIDHGSWSVLVHAFPAADIPVLQLSLHAQQPFSYHMELGRRLAALRERGILLLCSGNVVHNLRLMTRDQPDAAFDWNRRLDEAVLEVMTQEPAALAELQNHPDFALAAPTTEHFLPLLYLAGMAAASGETTQVLIEGYAMGSLSMTSYSLGWEPPKGTGDERGAPAIENVPGSQSNM